MSSRAFSVLALVVLFAFYGLGTASASGEDPCRFASSGSVVARGIVVGVTEACGGSPTHPVVAQDASPKTKTLNCGPKVYGPHAAWSTDPFCQQVQAACAVPVTNAMAADPSSTTLAFLQQNPGGPWQLTGMNCDAAAATAPPATVTPFDAYEQVVRLVPPAPIGAAPGRGSTLVNIQTIFWVSTPADRSLGTVMLLGHRVGLRIHAQAVAWDFGDGTADSHGVLGRAYTKSDSCTTVACPGFYGHQFTKTGPVTVTAAVTWSGQFTVDGGPWQDIANPANGANTVDGPATTTALRVYQARSELVSDPSAN